MRPVCQGDSPGQRSCRRRTHGGLQQWTNRGAGSEAQVGQTLHVWSGEASFARGLGCSTRFDLRCCVEAFPSGARCPCMSSQWEQACQGAELVSSKIVLLVQRANVVALAGVVEVVLDHRGARDDGELVVAGRTFRSRVAWRAGTRRDGPSPRSRPLRCRYP